MKKTTAENDPRAAARLRELMAEISVAMVTTVSAEGALHSRPMFTQDIRDEGELWFFTSDAAAAIHDLAEEHAVNVSYADPLRSHYVSVTGNANIVRDPEKIHGLWGPAMANFFPRGLDDPHLALLCVRIESAEYWDAPSSKMLPIGQSPEGGNRVSDVKGNDSGHTKVEIRAVRASG